LIKSLLRYGDISIFQNGGCRRLGFSKVGFANGQRGQEGALKMQDLKTHDMKLQDLNMQDMKCWHTFCIASMQDRTTRAFQRAINQGSTPPLTSSKWG